MISGFLAGCANRGNRVKSEDTDSSLVHSFVVKDSHGNAVENALVKATNVFGSTIDDQKQYYPSCITDKNGQCQFKLTSQFGGQYVKAYTTVMGEVSKTGYLPEPAHVTDTQGNSKNDAGLKVILDPAQQTILARFKSIDAQGSPLADVKFRATLPQYGVEVECTSDSLGTCEKDIEYKVAARNSVKILGEATLSGRYSQKSTREANFGQNNMDFNFTLDRSVDYLCDALKVPASQALANQMTLWVDSLRLKALIQDTVVQHGDFCTSAFKGKQYASVNLYSTSVFNSLKLNPYQIGVRMFDDVVRKMLDVVAPAVASFPLDGYEIAVKTAAGDAIEKYYDKKSLNYQFYLPKKSVVSYKNKDITGQQLIDASVILLNDERIDLKLQ